MPAPSYTYTLTNGTTADAPQVMQNFNDILNGVTDGTDDLTISAITCQGNFTVNGSSITLGNSSSDTLTVNASLGSHVVPSTTNTYDFGSSSIGVRSIYFADAGNASRGTRVIGGTIATGYTITLPTAAPASTKIVTMDNTGALAVAYDVDNSTLEVSSNSIRIKDGDLASNYSVTASVSGNALTIGVKGADGNALSATNAAKFSFRNATATTGTRVLRSATSISDLVISSGSTLGHTSGVDEWIYVGSLDNAGTLELCATSSPHLFDEGSVISTTAEGGAGAADSRTVMYSTTARSNVPFRWIGRLKSNQATAGTYASAISEIAIGSSDRLKNNPAVISVPMPDSGLRVVRGKISSDGTKSGGEGFTSSKDGSHTYTITFSPAFSDTPAVCFQELSGVSGESIPQLDTVTGNTCTMFWTEIGAGGAQQKNFYFIAVGAR